MDKKKFVWLVVALAIFVYMVVSLPAKHNDGDFTDVLYTIGDKQKTASDEMTDHVVSGVEGGTLVGEHRVNGSNWAIPNIIRHLTGVD